MADSSFDIVNKIDRQEVDNALNQAAKELSQRFDFKNTGAKIEWKGELAVEITADTEERASAALDVFRDKLVKRQISLKSLEAGEPAPGQPAGIHAGHRLALLVHGGGDHDVEPARSGCPLLVHPPEEVVPGQRLVRDHEIAAHDRRLLSGVWRP